MSDEGEGAFDLVEPESRGRLTMAEQIDAGSARVNNIHRSNHDLRFGGMKESGIEREKGRYGIEADLEYKRIYLSYEVGMS